MSGCPHCTDFNPIWEELITDDNIKNKVKCIKIDSNNIPENFNVETFPTIILENGTKQINYDEYNKERTKENIIQFINDNIMKSEN